MKILSNEHIIILKYETIKILRKALCYKWERIILLVMIPELISQLILCEGSFKILSLFTLTPLFLACFYGVGEIRKEGIQELKKTERIYRRELSCIKKRSYSSKRANVFGQEYNHSFILSR